METYKVNDVVEVTYQAKGSVTGLVDVVMEIYDETKSKDAVDYPDVTMTEIGATGRYYGTFTPDTAGTWRAMVNSVTKPGKLVLPYNVVSHSIKSIGDTIDLIKDTVENISDPPTIG